MAARDPRSLAPWAPWDDGSLETRFLAPWYPGSLAPWAVGASRS